MSRSEEFSLSTLEGNGGCGLVVTNSDPILVFLQSIPEDTLDLLSDAIRNLAADLLSQSFVIYKDLRAVWSSSSLSKRPSLSDLFAGASFIFSSPKLREKNEELKDRLSKLQDLAERKAYRELVKDVAPKEDTVEPFSSYKDQIGFERRRRNLWNGVRYATRDSSFHSKSIKSGFCIFEEVEEASIVLSFPLYHTRTFFPVQVIDIYQYLLLLL